MHVLLLQALEKIKKQPQQLHSWLKASGIQDPEGNWSAWSSHAKEHVCAQMQGQGSPEAQKPGDCTASVQWGTTGTHR